MANFPSSFSTITLALLTVGLGSALPIYSAAQDQTPPGAVIYRKLCIDCHGDHGQGVDGKYDEALAGELSLTALARKIDKTMPEDNEGACVGEDAKLVAAYIYDAFYSPAAQAKNNPPAKDLSRLTIPQYRASVMDVIGRFPGKFNKDRPLSATLGLKASYRGLALPKPGDPPEDAKKKKEKRFDKNFDRTDERVAFHFGAESPDKAQLRSERFQTRWEGSVIADDSGVYEFTIKTENGARLWVNNDNDDHALIDAWVSSGPMVREETKNIYLVGGRAYRIVLDHFKFNEASASIELWWRTPHGVKEIIPKESLRPDRSQERMIVSTTFPADDRSVGYERGTSISKAWDQAVIESAVATAEYVIDHLDRLAATKLGAPDRGAKLKAFALDFVSLAFRRPLSDEQKQLYIESIFASAKSPEVAVKRVVLLALDSPHFLYPDLHERIQPDGFDIASRLALALWDSIPDRDLMDAAEKNKLQTRDAVLAQARRMIADERTKAKLDGFFHQWLDLERAEAMSKDPKAFPGFDASAISDLRESLLRFIKQVVWSDTSDYRQLLQADYLLLNDRLGKLYGQPVTGSEFQPIKFDPKQRAGVVTHPYLLAALASSKLTSPIHRGVFLTRNIVGMALKPPPMAVAFEDSHFNPKLTMREKVTELTQNNNCMSCHAVINPLGFSLENFDAIGRWRTKDNNKPVNPVTEFANEEGHKVKLSGPRDIVNYVADNPSGHRAFIRHLFNHTVKQHIPAYGSKVLDELQHNFAANQCNIQKLLADIALIAAMDGMK